MIARALAIAVVYVVARTSVAAGTPPCVDAGLVMVRATYDDSHIERGAGNVIKIGDVHTYVLTARHVIAQREVASKIEVGFKSESPATHTATVLEQSDSDDWAVLDVAMSPTHRADSLCPIREADELKQGDRVHYVGQPTDPLVSWAVGDGEVTNFAVGKIYFTPTVGALSVGKGFSGGALYDDAWRLVGVITNTEDRNGIALSARSILQVIATGENPLVSDLVLVEPPREILLALGAAATFASDHYIHWRGFPPATAEALFELVGWRVGRGRFLLMAGPEASLALLSRTKTITNFPGAAPMTGSTVTGYVAGVGGTFRAQLQCQYAALFVDAGAAYEHLNDSGPRDDTGRLVLGAGISFRIPRGVPVSFFARARLTMPSTFEVPDSRFTLSGQPGDFARPVDDPVLVVFGAEYRAQ